METDTRPDVISGCRETRAEVLTVGLMSGIFAAIATSSLHITFGFTLKITNVWEIGFVLIALGLCPASEKMYKTAGNSPRVILYTYKIVSFC